MFLQKYIIDITILDLVFIILVRYLQIINLDSRFI